MCTAVPSQQLQKQFNHHVIHTDSNPLFVLVLTVFTNVKIVALYRIDICTVTVIYVQVLNKLTN